MISKLLKKKLFSLNIYLFFFEIALMRVLNRLLTDKIFRLEEALLISLDLLVRDLAGLLLSEL